MEAGVAVGPDEYREIRLGCMGRILTSTNVGTRLNLRYYKERAKVAIPPGQLDEVVSSTMDKVGAVLDPFIRAPGGKPRPLVVFVYFVGKTRHEYRFRVLQRLTAAFRKSSVGQSGIHELGLLGYVPRGRAGAKRAELYMDWAVVDDGNSPLAKRFGDLFESKPVYSAFGLGWVSRSVLHYGVYFPLWLSHRPDDEPNWKFRIMVQLELHF